MWEREKNENQMYHSPVFAYYVVCTQTQKDFIFSATIRSITLNIMGLFYWALLVWIFTLQKCERGSSTSSWFYLRATPTVWWNNKVWIRVTLLWFVFLLSTSLYNTCLLKCPWSNVSIYFFLVFFICHCESNNGEDGIVFLEGCIYLTLARMRSVCGLPEIVRLYWEFSII